MTKAASGGYGPFGISGSKPLPGFKTHLLSSKVNPKNFIVPPLIVVTTTSVIFGFSLPIIFIIYYSVMISAVISAKYIFPVKN